MRKRTKLKLAILLVAPAILLAFQNCGGGFTSGMIANQSSFGSNDTFANKFVCSNPATRGMGDTEMRRLIKSELVNTLTELLGSNIMSNNDIQTQLGLLSTDKIANSVIDITPDSSDQQVASMVNISATASELAYADNATRSALFGSCASDANVSDTCVNQFITNYGLKVFRRPVTSAEATDYLAAFKAAGDSGEGFKRLLMRFLLNPTLAFHIETGASTQNGRLRLTDYEVASRISYRTAGTMPDAALFADAAAGKLQNVANVEAHVRRLMNSNANAKSRLADFFRYYLNLDNVATPYAGAAKVQSVNADNLREEIVQETRDYVDNIVWNKKGTYADLLTSKDVFPKSDRMAKILETTQSSNGVAVQTTAAHAGLLLRPSLLASGSDRVNPMARAAVVRKRILCETMGLPDPNKVASRQNEVGDLSALTNRAKYETLTSPTNCMLCHTRLNPIAFSLEGYDQLGMRRSQESIFDSNGNFVEGRPINTNVDNPVLGGNSPSHLTDGVDLAEAVAANSTAQNCFVQTVYEYQRWRKSASSDSCALSEVATTAQQSGSVLDIIVKSVANEDIFWRAL